MTPFIPTPKIAVRAAIAALLGVVVFSTSRTWCAGLIASLAVAAIFGTFPRASLDADWWKKEWFVVFVPVHIRRCRLIDATQIETDVEDRMSWETSFVLAIFIDIKDVIWIWILDRFMWGDYKLWVRLGSGERILVWQGNGERNFRRNLEMLEDVLGLPVTRG